MRARRAGRRSGRARRPGAGSSKTARARRAAHSTTTAAARAGSSSRPRSDRATRRARARGRRVAVRVRRVRAARLDAGLRAACRPRARQRGHRLRRTLERRSCLDRGREARVWRRRRGPGELVPLPVDDDEGGWLLGLRRRRRSDDGVAALVQPRDAGRRRREREPDVVELRAGRVVLLDGLETALVRLDDRVRLLAGDVKLLLDGVDLLGAAAKRFGEREVRLDGPADRSSWLRRSLQRDEALLARLRLLDVVRSMARLLELPLRRGSRRRVLGSSSLLLLLLLLLLLWRRRGSLGDRLPDLARGEAHRQVRALRVRGGRRGEVETARRVLEARGVRHAAAAARRTGARWLPLLVDEVDRCVERRRVGHCVGGGDGGRAERVDGESGRREGARVEDGLQDETRRARAPVKTGRGRLERLAVLLVERGGERWLDAELTCEGRRLLEERRARLGLRDVHRRPFGRFGADRSRELGRGGGRPGVRARRDAVRGGA